MLQMQRLERQRQRQEEVRKMQEEEIIQTEQDGKYNNDSTTLV